MRLNRLEYLVECEICRADQPVLDGQSRERGQARWAHFASSANAVFRSLLIRFGRRGLLAERSLLPPCPAAARAPAQAMLALPWGHARVLLHRVVPGKISGAGSSNSFFHWPTESGWMPCCLRSDRESSHRAVLPERPEASGRIPLPVSCMLSSHRPWEPCLSPAAAKRIRPLRGVGRISPSASRSVGWAWNPLPGSDGNRGWAAPIIRDRSLTAAIRSRCGSVSLFQNGAPREPRLSYLNTDRRECKVVRGYHAAAVHRLRIDTGRFLREPTGVASSSEMR